MTLVGGLSIAGMPAFVGDLLESWRIPTRIHLPTRAAEEIHQTCDGNFACGLSQKLIIVRPYLLIAWAGSVSTISRLVNDLDKILPASFEQLSEGQTNEVFSALNVLPNDVEVVALFNSDKAVHPFCIHTRGFEFDNKRFYVLGSGSEDFFQFASYASSVIPAGVENSEGMAARAVLVNFVANALMAQFVSEHGLDASWGGGFEIAYPTPSGFLKLDNFLARCWSINLDGQLGNVGRSFLMHYEGAALKLTSFGDGEHTTTINSLVATAPAGPARKEVRAEWIVDLFYRESDGTRAMAVQQEFPWSKSENVFFFEDGELVGWHMDKSRVDKIISEMEIKNLGTQAFRIMTL